MRRNVSNAHLLLGEVSVAEPENAVHDLWQATLGQVAGANGDRVVHSELLDGVEDEDAVLCGLL